MWKLVDWVCRFSYHINRTGEKRADARRNVGQTTFCEVIKGSLSSEVRLTLILVN